MKRILMFSLAVGGVTLNAACGDDSGPDVEPREELMIVGDEPIQLPQGTIGVDYAATVEATGGTQRLINWTVVDVDQFPIGLYITTQLNPLNINGRPRVAGEFSFRLQVTDSGGEAAVKTFNMSVVEGPPELQITTESDPPDAPLGEEYLPYTFSATGGSGTGYVFSADPDSLPTGMNLSPDGELSGTPTRDGTFPFVVQVRDSVGDTATRNYTLNVIVDIPIFRLITGTPPVDVNGTCRDGKADEPYECELVMTGGVPPYEIDLGAGGGLPPGLEILQPGPSERSGFIRGVPTQPGNYAFQIRASDSARGVDRNSFFVEVAEADAPLRITGRIIYPEILDDNGEPTEAFDFIGYEVNKRLLAEIVAIGGSEEGYQWERADGIFPDGCTFTSSTPNAQLLCTPTRPGNFIFELVVTDSDGERSVPRQFTLSVRPAVLPVAITSATGLPGVTVLPPAITSTTGGPVPQYQQAIVGEGGIPSSELGYGWSVVPAEGLPPGLTIFPNGAPSTFIRGTPTSTGTYDFNIAIYDVENRTTSAPFRIEVVTSTSTP
jgi:hypothetical protein